MKRVLLFFAALLMTLVFGYQSITYAEKLPTVETDKIFLSNYTQLVNKCDYIYKVAVEMEVKGKEAMIPPTILTFVLDATASMDAVDGTGISRDVKVREAMVESFRILMSQDEEIKKNTFINIIAFGSTGDKSISLTEWASTGTPVLTTLKNPASSFYMSAGSSIEYVPLLNPLNNTKLNPVLAQLFYCDYDTLDLKPSGLPATLDSAYPISQQYFYGNDQASITDGLPGKGYSSRFPIHSWGTAINGGMSRAYYSLKDKINNVRSDPSYTTEELNNLEKYVMVLCDGADQTASGTQSYAAAIKAPENITIPTFRIAGGGMTTGGALIPQTVPAATTPNTGLNTEIWSMVIGTEGYLTAAAIALEDGWKTTYLAGGLSAAPFARNMISIAAMPVTAAGWNTFAANVLPANWNNYYTQYCANLNASNFPDETNYLRTVLASEAKAYFAKFAMRSEPAVGAGNVVAKGMIPPYFTVYGLTNSEYRPTTFSNNLAHTPTVTVSGDNTLTWNAGLMDPGEKVQLVYYIQLKPEYQSTDLWYRSMDRFSVSYDGASGSFVNINLPESLLHSHLREKDCGSNGSGATPFGSSSSNDSINDLTSSSSITLDGSIPGTGNNPDSSNSSNINGNSNTSIGSQLATAPAPYTASVTIQSTKAPSKLEDEHLEEAAEQMPITGYKTILLFIASTILVFSIYVTIKTKKHKK